VTGFSADVRQTILARSEGYCEVMAPGCDLTATDIHHRRPRGMGGTKRSESNLASNSLNCCRKCHLRCEAMRNWARENGFVIWQSDDPAKTPVFWRSRFSGSRKVFVLLNDAGNILEVGSDGNMEASTAV
jgi:5-methylcytosine-specific restriction protein A